MNVHTVTQLDYLPTDMPPVGHRCTSCVDALLPDEPGEYRGRHRADMAVYVPSQLVDNVPTLSCDGAPLTELHGASCGSFLPMQPFRISHGTATRPDPHGLALMLIEPECDRGRESRHAPDHARSFTPSQSYADYVEGFTS